MSVEDIVKHCIEDSSISNRWDYKIVESEDEENTVILHAHPGFLTPELTEKLRRRLIFVDATSESIEDDHSVMYFLHYLEPEQDTFMDELAEPILTDNNIDAVTREIAETEIDETNSHRFNLGFISALNFVRERTSKDSDWESLPAESLPILQNFREESIEDAEIITEEEIEEVEDRLEAPATELFHELVETARERQAFYKTLNEHHRSVGMMHIRSELREIGDYSLHDIRKSEMARKQAEGENQQC